MFQATIHEAKELMFGVGGLGQVETHYSEMTFSA